MPPCMLSLPIFLHSTVNLLSRTDIFSEIDTNGRILKKKKTQVNPAASQTAHSEFVMVKLLTSQLLSEGLW